MRSEIDLELTAPKPMLRIYFIEGTLPMEVLKILIPFSNSTTAPMIKARELGHARNFLTEV
jgi:hypothetical protein